jgi:hypothetical protein
MSNTGHQHLPLPLVFIATLQPIHFDGQSNELERLTSDTQSTVSFGHNIGAAKGVLVSIAVSLLFWSVILLVSLA